MRYYSKDVVDGIIDDAIQYGIDIEAGGFGRERPFASHYPSVGSNWHTGTPTEEGWYLVKYICIHEGKYKGNIWYSTFRIEIHEDGYIETSGGIGNDDVWQPVEYLRIGDVWKPKETN